MKTNSDTPQNNTTIAAGNQNPTRPLWKRFILPLVILALIAGAIIVTVLQRDNNTGNKLAQSQQAAGAATVYNYTTLTSSKVEGTLTSLEFNRPKEFTKDTKASTIQKDVYAHTGSSNKQLAVLGGISAYATHPIIADNPPIDLDAAKNAFNSGSGYQAYLKSMGINDFITSELAHRYYGDDKSSQVNLTINKPSKFTNPNIKGNAWLFSFKASGTDQTSSGILGNLVFALGKSTDVYNGYNYLMLSTLDYNWQPNQQVWQQVIDSLKITEKNLAKTN